MGQVDLAFVLMVVLVLVLCVAWAVAVAQRGEAERALKSIEYWAKIPDSQRYPDHHCRIRLIRKALRQYHERSKR
jgi:hypothetical protein